MGEYQTVIGLEVHAQLRTNSKIFCACAIKFDSPPNTNICPVCCGYPGVLPSFNKKALALAVRVGLALRCRINPRLYFERKNYFYPDLPKNYQISQYKMPLAESGYLELETSKKIRVRRVHLEEDAGKLIHKKGYSLADFNRAGAPLLEIVSCPDINSPGEAFDYLNQLKLILKYIGASECDMEKGFLRCDANISLKMAEDKQLGTKVELKNMNTFKGVREALEYEVKRQKKNLSGGNRISQETRLWNPDESQTTAMRSKEEAHDYRYFPEPDLLDFFVPRDMIDSQKGFVSELPLARKKRFIGQFKLSEAEAGILISDKWLGDFFEDACRHFHDPKQIVNWLMGSFLELANNLGGTRNVKISAENFSKVVKYFASGRLNNLAAKKALSRSISTNEDIDSIIKQESLEQISDESALSKVCSEVTSEFPKPVKEYLAGKKEAVQFLIGQVMRRTKGKANPKLARELIEKAVKDKK